MLLLFVFQIRIEKKRQVIPSLYQALLKKKESQILNWHYFYSLLFMRDNLKLVNIICHDKRIHLGECDHSKFYC
jgi:DNA fragmentation factor 40 kDa